MSKLMIEEAEWDGELEVLGAEGAVRLKVVSAELVELVELDDRYKEEYGDLSIQLDLIMPPARERSSRTVSTPSTSSAPGTPPSPSSPLWRVSPCRTSCCGTGPRRRPSSPPAPAPSWSARPSSPTSTGTCTTSASSGPCLAHSVLCLCGV